MRRFLMIALSLLSTACASTVPVTAHFSGYNRMNANVALIVEGKEIGTIPPNSAANFRTKIEIPRGDYVLGPDNRYATVSVAVKNLTTGKLSEVTRCTAGERYLTTVTYEPGLSYGSLDRVTCNSSGSYGGTPAWNKGVITTSRGHSPAWSTCPKPGWDPGDKPAPCRAGQDYP